MPRRGSFEDLIRRHNDTASTFERALRARQDALAAAFQQVRDLPSQQAQDTALREVLDAQRTQYPHMKLTEIAHAYLSERDPGWPRLPRKARERKVQSLLRRWRRRRAKS